MGHEGGERRASGAAAGLIFVVGLGNWPHIQDQTEGTTMTPKDHIRMTRGDIGADVHVSEADIWERDGWKRPKPAPKPTPKPALKADD